MNPIPVKYTCDGDNRNPPLTFSQIPAGALTLVLIIDDPDAPNGTYTHWLLYNMPAATMQILEHEIPPDTLCGKNSTGTEEYIGPCPPPASPELQRGKSGKHRYRFMLYALDATLHLAAGATRQEVALAMEDHIMSTARLTGTYERK